MPVLGDDIDTDQIVPARFLKEIDFSNMGNYLFYDHRFTSSGEKKEHTLNDVTYEGAKFLLSGKNFGCGSSREHAPQAIKRYGITVILAQSYSEIFLSNCRVIGLVALMMDQVDLSCISKKISQNASLELTVNLESMSCLDSDGSKYVINMPESHRFSFLSGNWNTLSLLKRNEKLIEKKHLELPYRFFK